MTRRLNKFVYIGAGTVLVLVVVTVIAVTQTRGGKNENPEVDVGSPISFQEFLDRNFTPNGFNGTWGSDHNIQWTDANENLVSHGWMDSPSLKVEWNVDTGKTTILVASETMGLVSKTATFVSFAPNDKSLLLFYDNKIPIWRHSFFADYLVLDVKTKRVYNIAIPPESRTKLRHAQWRTGSSGNEILFVYDNNIYERKFYDNPIPTNPITTSGVVDEVYCGVPDWVYEEEVLGTNTAMHVSPDGQFLAYAEFDDKYVDSFYYTKYGEPELPLDNRYTNQIKLPYPKVGTSNPTIKVFLKNLTNSASPAIEIKPPKDFLSAFPKDYTYFRIYWITNDKLGVIWMNRVQNSGVTTECKKDSSWTCETIQKDKVDDGWLLIQDPVYHKDGTAFLQIMPQNVAGKSYRHIAVIESLKKAIFITSGEIVVTSILRWVGNKVYFLAAPPDNPGMRHFYVASTTSSSQDCITCDVTLSSQNTTCSYNDVQLSSDNRYYVHICAGPSVGEVVIRSLTTNTIIHVLEDNKELRARLVEKHIPLVRNLMVDVPGNFKAAVSMRLPQNYDPNGSKKYPVIVYVYGGPDSQQVSDVWSIGWGDFLVTNYDVVYVSIDGRGTGFQSNDFLYQVYRNLGTVEMEDQISVVKSLLSQNPFLDPDRVGIWGWSYGGYATLMTLVQDVENVFKCAISVAPPTDWLFYDTVYTERYMGLPVAQDNLLGYTKSSLLNKFEQLRGKNFMINHGVADDNVHYQHSMMLIRALEKADVQFIQNSYPDENHGLGGVKKFLYHTFDSYWTKCFGVQSVLS